MLLMQSLGILHALHVKDDKQRPCVFWGLFLPLLREKKKKRVKYPGDNYR